MVPPLGAHENALNNVDILAIILQELAFDADTQELRLNTACVACVSQTFAYVALPLAWRRVHDLFSLWNLLLPDDVPQKSPSYLAKRKNFGHRIQLINIVKGAKVYHEAARWRRFLQYASYVQRVDHSYYCGAEIDLLRSIIAHNEGCTFLPALRCLSWSQGRESGTTLTSLSTISLVELRFSHVHGGIPEDFEQIMALLPSCFPVLHTFVLVQDCSGAGPSEVQLYTPLKDMKCLRSLRIDSECRRLDYDRLRQLFATFPLEDLYFWVANSPVDDLTCPRPIDAPQLQSLESKGSVVDMTALLSHLHAPALTAFEFEDGSFELTPDHMLHLCTVVSTRFPRTLKSLSLSLQTPSKTELRVNAVVNLIRDILHPVLNMKQLERLSFVYLHYQVPITALMDEDIELLAQKLPNLRFLELFYDDDYIYDGWQPLTAMSLLYLAQRCPHLEELHIQVIETDLQDLVIPASAPTPANDHPLRMLAIRDLYFEDGLEENDGLKQLLDRLFPNLRAAGPSPVLPKSLQFPELCSRYFVSESWERCEAAYPRNVFVCA